MLDFSGYLSENHPNVDYFTVSNPFPLLLTSKAYRTSPSTPCMNHVTYRISLCRIRFDASVVLSAGPTLDRSVTILFHFFRFLGSLFFFASSVFWNCSLINRTNFQVAYTAMEAAGQTYRRQCHVFQTEDNHQVRSLAFTQFRWASTYWSVLIERWWCNIVSYQRCWSYIHDIGIKDWTVTVKSTEQRNLQLKLNHVVTPGQQWLKLLFLNFALKSFLDQTLP